MEEEGYVQREITTDDSENNAQLETLYSYSKGTLYIREEESEVWNQTEKNDNLPVVLFGTFERIKLDGKTYMTFCVRDNLDLIEYNIIPDNKFTENRQLYMTLREQREPQSIQWITSKNTRRFPKRNWSR